MSVGAPEKGTDMRLIFRSFIVATSVLLSSISPSFGRDRLEVTITPANPTATVRDFLDAYLPLSGGGFVDFSTWMQLKYGLGPWSDDAVIADQFTGQTARLVYGLAPAEQGALDEEAYDKALVSPSCGLFSKLALGKGECRSVWQSDLADVQVSALNTPQMLGMLDTNALAALTPADQEMGRVQLFQPAAVMSMVP